MNYEYCTALDKRGNVIKEIEIDISPTHQERYISMFGFDNSIYEHLEYTKTLFDDKGNQLYRNGSVSGFNGSLFCKWLNFDIDSEDLNASHQMAKDFVAMLYSNLEVNPKNLFICFSGNKGFHIGLHQNLFGGFEPSKKLHERINVLAVKVLEETFGVTTAEIQEEVKKGPKGKKIFNLMDLSIYTPNRIFRAINSKNHKSGLYKIGLTYEQLNTLTIDQIRILAKEPLPYSFETPPNKQKCIRELQSFWQYALSFDIANYNATQKKHFKSDSSAFFHAPEIGNRNNDLFKQAAMLFDKSEFNEQQVLQIIGLINNNCQQPLPIQELETIVKSAFRKTIPNKVFKQEPVKEVENFTDWLDEWADYYTTDKKPFTLLFDEIDKDQENNFTGKLVCLIGPGGTRKSYYALNILGANILEHKARGIYSSMEMGKVEMVNRVLDNVFPPENGVPASKLCKQNIRRDKTGYLSVLIDAAKELHDKLILSSVSGKTAGDYLKDYNKAVELYGGVDFLVVDGLSMMGGTGTETERFEKHTKELKGLANSTGLSIFLICHTTKEAKPYTRDSSQQVRGSGKILDNCDFWICFSNIINEITSTPENIEYEKLFAHIKYYNKRGTGMMLNKIYDFDPLSKAFIPSGKDPRHFPDYDAFVKQYNSKQRKKNKDDDF